MNPYWKLAEAFFGMCLLFSPLMFVVWVASPHSSYRRHERNPYIRICKRCGQTQGEFGWTMRRHPDDHYEALGEIIDKNCKCHKDCGE